MALDRWQQQLCDLLAVVQVKQRQYDQAVSACQILLKPWPKKSQESEAGVKKDAPDNSNNAADTKLSPREEAELKVVNDLLKRAQKTRVKNSSQKPKQQHVFPADDDPSPISGRELWEVCSSEPQNSQEPAPKRNAESTDLKPASATKADDSQLHKGVRKNMGVTPSQHPSRKYAVPKQQQTGQPARDGGDQSSRSVRERHSTISNVKKPFATGGDQKRPKSLESGRRVTSQPSSQPRSGQGRFQPAHASAPFKTDSSLQVPKRSVKNSMRPALKQYHGGHRQNYAGDRNSLAKALPPISSERDSSSDVAFSSQGDCEMQSVCNTPSVPPEGDPQPHPAVEHQAGWSQEEADSNKAVASNTRQTTSGCEETSSRLSGLTLEADSSQDSARCGVSDGAVGPSCTEGHGVTDVEKEEVKLFSLLTEGASINIPPKVRRAFSRNQQMRRKMSQRATDNKGRSAENNPALSFCNQLQEIFEPEEELLYRQQSLECLRSHQQLLTLLSELNLDSVTEESSAEDILRAKTLAEFVLSSFSELSEEASMLSRVKFGDNAAVAEPSVPQAAHPYLWLPASLQGNNMCWADRLLYRSKTELNCYMSQILRLQTLQCQRHLIDILITDVLPWLQQQDCQQEGFGTIFRGLFSLLTSDGSHQPALICDPES